MSAVRYLILFLVFFNAGGLLLQATGTADYLGIEPSTGNNDQLDEGRQSVGGAGGEGNSNDGTLFGFYRQTTDTLDVLLNAINPGKQMLQAAIPVTAAQDFITFSFAGAWALIGFKTLEFLRGVRV